MSDDLVKRLRELIDDAQSDMADDLADGEYTGERPDLNDYHVDLSLAEALALRARIEADAERIAGMKEQYERLFSSASRHEIRADAAEARIAELEAALRPFVQCVERYEHLPGVIALFSDVTTERARKMNILPREVFYRARAALGETGQ